MRIRSAALLLAGLSLALGLSAQEPAAQKPLSEAELVSLVNAKTPVADIIAQVRARGFDFDISAEMETALGKVEGGPDLLGALREPATLEVSVNVAGAEVAVDAEARGHSTAQGPVVVTGLAPRNHLIRVQAEHFLGERVQVFLKPGEKHRVDVTLIAAVEVKPGPLGLDINVRAGTKEDSLVATLEATRDPTTRVQHLRQIITDYGDTPLALLAYRMLQATYLEQSQFAEALAAGEEALKRDPKSFLVRVRQARAYLGQGEVESAFEATAAAHKQLDDVRSQAGEVSGGAEASSARATTEALAEGESSLQGLAYSFFSAAVQLPDLARKSAALERYLELYPQSDYTQPARVNLAYAYLQQNNVEKALGAAGAALQANPNEGSLLVLVADTLSDRGQELARARQLATQLLTLLDSEPDKIRPAGMADEQWAAQRETWQGMGHSILGQVLMYEETAQTPAGMSKTRQAIKEFLAASPLLKSQTQLYARNLFRLGFAYAKIGELAQARDALNEVISLDTPYREPARPYLDKVLEGLQRKKP